MTKKTERTNAEWHQDLTPQQYQVLRMKGTDAPFSGPYTDLEANGTYACAACGEALFSSETKFHSGSGWPSFDAPISADAVAQEDDGTHGMKRTEVLCKSCGGHLGHVFPDGPSDTTGLRYCINSTSLNFKPEK